MMGWLLSPTSTLAAQGYADAIWIALTGMVLIALLIACWLVFAWLRRRLNAPPKTDDGNLWTLDGLRQLRSDGLLNEEEYNRLRARLLDAFRSKSSPSADQPAEPAGQHNQTEPDNPAERPGPDSDEPSGDTEHRNNDPDNDPAV